MIGAVPRAQKAVLTIVSSASTLPKNRRAEMRLLAWSRALQILCEAELDERDEVAAFCQTWQIAVIPTTMAEISRLEELQVRPRRDWLAVFTAEFRGNSFPFVRWGRTPEEERIYVGGTSRLLDTVVEQCLSLRGPGRFFVQDVGVFWKDSEAMPWPIILFDRQ